MIYFLFFILISLSAFFSACEMALFSISPGQVRLIQDKNLKNAKLIYFFKKNSQKTLITILVANNIFNILIASLATYFTTNILGSFGIGLATGLVTLFIVIFGEIIPKTFGQKNNQKVAQIFSPLLYLFYILLSPLVWVLRGFNNTFMRILKMKENIILAEEEIKSLSRLGVEKGNIHFHEHKLIEKTFLLNDITVKDVMTPRYKIVFINGEVPVEGIAHFVGKTGYSRYPVFENNEDQVIGYVHVHDIMKVLNSDDRSQPVKKYVREVTTLVETKTLQSAFKIMIRGKAHLALVRRSENNEIIGLVSLEDILEHLVGEIEDEAD
jgi:CBS domain containing-hemolysin-like protein